MAVKKMLVDMITGVVISQVMVTVKTYETKKSPKWKTTIAVTAI
ncbi:unnamed protein product [Commensalibacter communis]|nr:unnamed protein product [Commensalibacter communis]